MRLSAVAATLPGTLVAGAAMVAVVTVLTTRLPWPEGSAQGLVAFGVGVAYLWLGALVPMRGRAMPPEWRECRGILVTAFVLRSGVAFVSSLSPLVERVYRVDALGYDDNALTIATGWWEGRPAFVETSSFGVDAYQYANAAVYVLAGHSMSTMQVLNALIGTLAIYWLYVTARELWGRPGALAVAAVTAAWPSNIFWTSQNFRDPLVFYLTARALHASVVSLRSRRWQPWARTLIIVGVAGLARAATGFLLFAGLLAVAVQRVVARTPWRLRPAMLCALALVVVALLYVVRDQFFFFYLRGLDPEHLTAMRQGRATGGSQFFPDLTYDSWLDILRWTPILLATVVLRPHILESTNTIQLLAGVENLVLLALLVLAAARLGRLRALARPDITVIAVFVVLGFVAMAVVEGNLGTAFRHKAQFVPALMLLLLPAWPLVTSAWPSPPRGPGEAT